MIRRASEMRTEIRQDMKGGRGPTHIQHYLTKEDFGAAVRLCAKLILPPGASIGPHRHDNEDEVFIIQRGRGIVDDGRQQTPVTAGDVTITGRGESHSIANAGSEDLEITAIIACYHPPAA